MEGYDEDWLARRIAKRLSRHYLSVDSSIHQLYPASARVLSCVPSHLLDAISSGVGGTAVLAVISDIANPHQCSVLSTHAIVYSRNGETLSIALDQISHCSAMTIRMLPKGEHEYLAISTVEGTVTNLWVRAGADFYALWNIITDVIRLHERK